MTELDPNEFLLRLFEAHGLSCSSYKGWIVPNNELPAIRASWRHSEGQEKIVRLDVDLLIKPNRFLQESFAGVGEGEAGVKSALQNFLSSSLHVLLAGFWRLHEGQVEIERWHLNTQTFDAFIGPYTQLGEVLADPSTVTRLAANVEAALKRQKLDGETHWARLFYGNVSGRPTFEALLDNEDWPEGLECLQTAGFGKFSGYYSLRNFMVLRPASTTSVRP